MHDGLPIFQKIQFAFHHLSGTPGLDKFKSYLSVRQVRSLDPGFEVTPDSKTLKKQPAAVIERETVEISDKSIGVLIWVGIDNGLDKKHAKRTRSDGWRRTAGLLYRQSDTLHAIQTACWVNKALPDMRNLVTRPCSRIRVW